MKLNNTLKKAIAFALTPLLFVACNTTSEDPIPLPEPEPDPIVKTPVVIPDAEFEKLLLVLGIDTDGEVNQQFWLEDAADVTQLDLFSSKDERKIKDLTGIEAFTSLKFLILYNNALTHVDLSALRELEMLDVEFNELETLVLSENSKLKKLFATGNNLTEIDLSQNPDLEHLEIGGNLLETIDLSENKKLEEVRLIANLLTEVKGIQEAKSLKRLFVGYNELTNLELNNPTLEGINLEYNYLTSLDLSGSTSLEYVLATANKLHSINTTDNLELKHLKTSYNELIALDLSTNIKLEELWVSANKLSNLDVSMLPDLYDLRTLFNEALTCIKIAEAQNIATLKLSDHQSLSTTSCD